MKSRITINNLAKRFGEKIIYDDFNLEISAGHITVIFGPNGCGKSTLMHILSGEAAPDRGGFRIENFQPKKFSYIFQNYRQSLLPWLNVYDNLALPLMFHGYSKKEIDIKVREILNCSEFFIDFQKYPYELSGGQQQIVAFLRALVTEPDFLLIDDGFSALDYENSLKLKSRLLSYCKRHKPTVLLISHDVEEAIHLADRILVFSKSPVRIVDDIKNTLDEERTVRSLYSNDFRTIKRRVLTAFYPLYEV